MPGVALKRLLTLTCVLHCIAVNHPSGDGLDNALSSAGIDPRTDSEWQTLRGVESGSLLRSSAGVGEKDAYNFPNRDKISRRR